MVPEQPKEEWITGRPIYISISFIFRFISSPNLSSNWSFVLPCHHLTNQPLLSITPLLIYRKPCRKPTNQPTFSRWRNGNWWPPWKLPQLLEPNSKPPRRSGCRIRTLLAGRDFQTAWSSPNRTGVNPATAASLQRQGGETNDVRKTRVFENYPCHALLMVSLRSFFVWFFKEACERHLTPKRPSKGQRIHFVIPNGDVLVRL